jgi:probable F420-dependent oxidoreductase
VRGGLRVGLQGSGQLVEGLPEPSFFRAVVERAEALGYDSLWAGDHLSFLNPILDVVVALSAFAALSERILLGAGVLLLPLRQPGLVAKEMASLDWLSGGRLLLGVGVGGEGQGDFQAAGVDPSERGERADEAMRALRKLFSGTEADFQGRFFSFRGVRIDPPPAQPGGPPLWVGGRSPAAIRRAGRLGDGWMPIWVSPRRFAEGWREVRREAAEAGRDPDTLEPAVVLPARVEDDGAAARRRAREHLSRRYGRELQEPVIDRYCLVGAPKECVGRLQEYARAGVRHVVLNLCAGPEDFLLQAERLALEVVAGLPDEARP